MLTVEQLNERMLPLGRLIGVEVVAVEAERLTARLLVRDDLCTTHAIAHGGTIMALADTLGGLATFVNLPAGATGTTTIESKTNFVGAAKAGQTLIAIATPIHRGRRTQVWQTRIETGDGRLVSVTSQTQLVL